MHLEVCACGEVCEEECLHSAAELEHDLMMREVKSWSVAAVRASRKSGRAFRSPSGAGDPSEVPDERASLPISILRASVERSILEQQRSIVEAKKREADEEKNEKEAKKAAMKAKKAAKEAKRVAKEAKQAARKAEQAKEKQPRRRSLRLLQRAIRPSFITFPKLSKLSFNVKGLGHWNISIACTYLFNIL
jgi:hypothetical protein